MVPIQAASAPGRYRATAGRGHQQPWHVEIGAPRQQQEQPGDYVVATGETHSVGDFVERAFERAELDWKEHVEVNQAFIRPAEVDLLIGDASKAKRELGWQPEVTFEGLVDLMVDADMEMVASEVSNGQAQRPRLTALT